MDLNLKSLIFLIPNFSHMKILKNFKAIKMQCFVGFSI